MLVKNWSFTAMAVAAMALGMGANTAIFTLVDALIWKPLPFPNIDRVVMIAATEKARGDLRDDLSAPDYLDFKSQNTTLGETAAYAWNSANLTGQGDPERVQGYHIGANLLRILGVEPMLGRAFMPEEEQSGRNNVAILSYGLWTRRFGAGTRIVGQSIQLDGRAHTVVGVMPRGFQFPLTAQIWTPLVFSPRDLERRGAHYLSGVGLLKPVVTTGQATKDLDAIAQRLAKQYPGTNAGVGARVGPLHELTQGDLTAQFSHLLMGAVLLVLLIACANVANLQFVLAGGRRREFAVRTALGASRWRVVRLMVMESVLVAVAGAAVGLLIGLWGMDLLVRYMPPDVSQYIANWDKIALDGRALAFTFLLALASGLISGAAPSLVASRTQVGDTLKDGGRGSSPGRGRYRLRSALVIAEVSLALLLMAGAALLVKGFRALVHDEAHMHAETLLTLRMNILESRYREREKVAAFVEAVVSRMVATPGLGMTAAVTDIPRGGSRMSGNVEIEGRPETRTREARRTAQLQSATPGYFAAMRIPLLSGRDFDSRDGSSAAKVAIVSEAFARKFFPGEDAIGKSVGWTGPEGSWWRIVGVVADVRHETFDREVRPAMYRPFAQAPTRRVNLVVRAAVDPAALVSACRAQIAAVERDQPVFEVKSFQQLIDEERIGLTYVAVLMGIMGGIALALASVGVYGVMAYSVTERTHEIGVRMALGAARSDVMTMVLRGGLRLTAIGLAIGLALSYANTRLLSSLVFGVSADDVATPAAVALALAGIALLACYFPARRATRVDPMEALRYE